MRDHALMSICAVTLLFAGSVVAFAQDTPWHPPAPDPASRDWLRLVSGEWLRGRIELMRDEVISFDSEQLEDLEIDWQDVVEIRSPRILTFAFLDGRIATGTSRLRDGILRVDTGETVREFDPATVHAIIEGHLTEANFWSARATASFVTRNGNTEQTDFTSYVNLRRETARTRLDLRYQGNYGSIEDEESANNHRGNADFRLFLSRRLFVTPAAVELFTDRQQNIELRSGANAGVGYYLLRGGTDWWFAVGGGWQRTRYASVQAGEDESVDNGTVGLGTTLEADLTSAIELDAEYSLKVNLGDDQTMLHHTFVLLSFDVWGDILDFTASITWDHNTDPKPDASGAVPRKNDVITAYGLGIDF